jgi:hypothetical protein
MAPGFIACSVVFAGSFDITGSELNEILDLLPGPSGTPLQTNPYRSMSLKHQF